MSSSGENMFITQSRHCVTTEKDLETDSILSDCLDMEETVAKNIFEKPNFDLQFRYSDISDVEVENKSPLKGQSKENRFSKPLTDQDLQSLIKSGLSSQTENKSKWAVNLYLSWRKQRPTSSLSNENDLLNLSSEELNRSLSFFIAEVRKESGEDYRPNTLYEIIISIQHYLRRNGKLISFLDDLEFSNLRSVLDGKMKQLSKAGYGINVKRADVITLEQEKILWSKGILGDDTPQKLLDTLIYLFGLNFALRAGQEHRNLRTGPLSQLSIGYDKQHKKYVQYKEDVSKSNRGGLLHKRVDPKITRAYENISNPSQCPVKLYERYLLLRPKNGKSDAFYLRPKRNPSSDVWYCDSPIGVHVLQQTISKLCEKAGFKGHYTNHSLRVTAATRLYEAGVDEQLIVEKTGHRSNAVRTYKRTSDDLQVGVSEILAGGKKAKSDNNRCDLDEQPEIDSSKASTSEKREMNIKTPNVSITLKF